MCKKENFIEQSTIDIFIDVFQDDLCLSSKEIEDLVKRIKLEQDLHSIIIDGDMNFTENIDLNQIKMWLSFVVDIVFLIQAFKKSKENRNHNQRQSQNEYEENMDKEILEFEKFLSGKDIKYINMPRYKRKITKIYKSYANPKRKKKK